MYVRVLTTCGTEMRISEWKQAREQRQLRPVLLYPLGIEQGYGFGAPLVRNDSIRTLFSLICAVIANSDYRVNL